MFLYIILSTENNIIFKFRLLYAVWQTRRIFPSEDLLRIGKGAKKLMIVIAFIICTDDYFLVFITVNHLLYTQMVQGFDSYGFHMFLFVFNEKHPRVSGGAISFTLPGQANIYFRSLSIQAEHLARRLVRGIRSADRPVRVLGYIHPL